MKYLSIIILFSFSALAGLARTENNVKPSLAEYYQDSYQELELTATLKSSSRLFKAKEDLTSVILVIPSGSSVIVTGSDSTYFKVLYEDYEGFIFRKHATINKSETVASAFQAPKQQTEQPVANNQQNPDRFTRLENKYGTSMAARIYSGKIWKGMNSEMVRDSWGKAIKINRVVNGNVIQEEWLYNNTWLYIENNTLVDWGPVNKQQ